MFQFAFFYIDKPGAPGKPIAEIVDKNTIKISWTASSTDGGTPVAGYCIERMVGKNGTWDTIKDKVSLT